VDPFNDSITRGQQLAAAVAAIRQETGFAKVNLIGHSQGGLDSRYVAHEHPDWVASVTTVSTPHGGSPVADIALMVVPSDLLQDLLDSLVQLIGGPIWDAVGNETSLAASMKALSPAAAEVFNKAFPDAPGVAYYSIAGRSDHHLGLLACGPDGDAPAFIDDWKWTTDPIDASLSITEIILDGGLFNPYPNDGLVRVEDAKWGTFLGCIPADHLDQIGHRFGDKPGLFNGWSHKAFYAELASWLHAQGY
jgi:triacylglycerol lipase